MSLFGRCSLTRGRLTPCAGVRITYAPINVPKADFTHEAVYLRVSWAQGYSS